MKTKPVQVISPRPASDRGRQSDAATSSALQVKRGLTIGALARALGFSLRQLQGLGQTLADRDARTSAFRAKSAEIDARIEALTRARATLAAMLACDCGDARTCERVG